MQNCRWPLINYDLMRTLDFGAPFAKMKMVYETYLIMFVVRRSHLNPFIAPGDDDPWLGTAVFNWCPIVSDKDGIMHALFRALSLPDPMRAPKISSSIGYAYSKDGDTFEGIRQVISPEEEWEKYGCEDPRVTYFEGKYYIFYTAISEYPVNTPKGIRIALATTKDFVTFKKHGLIGNFSAKAMSLFPERINGKITLVLTVDPEVLPKKIAIAQMDSIDDLTNSAFWESWYKDIESHRILGIERHKLDQVEIGAPPVLTEKGWLLIYSHIENHEGSVKDYQYVYGIEALLLNKNNPCEIIGKTKTPMMTPKLAYERNGFIKDTIFPSGALEQDGKLLIYYGAADTVCARASLRLNDLIDTLYPTTAKKSRISRVSDSPIIVPNPVNDWESKAVLNPAVADIDGTINIFYRAMGQDDTSVIGLATSEDGVNIDERLSRPIYVPRADFEMKKHPGNSGCEDPRVTVIENNLYMFYTAYDGTHPPQVAETQISLEDFRARKWEKWSSPQIISPPSFDDKDACIFSGKVKDKYVFMHRLEGNVCFDFFDSLDFSKERADSCSFVLGPRPGMWDNLKVGIAGPPHKTEAGWLLFYHGVSGWNKKYRVGAVLLDLNSPSHILGRSTDFLQEPELKWEEEGIVPGVVFPCGSAIRGDTVYIYYGGADTVIGVATIPFAKLLSALKK